MVQTVHPQTVVRDLLFKHPETRDVFDRFGIDYCRGGTRDLKTATAEDGVALDALLDALNDALETLSKGGATEGDWSEASASELADHIEQRIHISVKKALPKLQSLIVEAAGAGEQAYDETLSRLGEVLESLVTEIVMHIIRKEQVLFPLIRQLETYAQGHGDKPADRHCAFLRKPICEIEREYGNVVGAVVKMRALTADYSLPGEPGGSFAALNEALRKLDEDLRKQIHLESNVLFPLAIELEKLSTG